MTTFFRASLLIAFLGLNTTAGFAATRTWDGSSSGLWTTAANWDLNTVPANGDALIFPPGPARLLTTNSAGGATNFHSIGISGSNYFLFGPLLSLTNGLTVSAALNSTNTIAARVLVRTNQSWNVGLSNTLILSSNIGFTNVTWLLTNQGNIQFHGAMASASSTMVSTGAGRIYFVPGASGQASLTMQQGRLRVDASTAINVAVNANAVLSGTGTVSSISAHGVVSPGNDGPAVLATGSTPSFFFNGSTLALDLNGTAPGAGHDQLRVGFPPTLTGATLALSIGFNPKLGDVFVIVTNQSATPMGSDQFIAGLPEGATFTVSNVQFRLSYSGGSHNDVTLTVIGFTPSSVTRTWDGGGANGFWSNPTNWAGDIAPATGDDLVFPAGALRLSNTNDFSAGAMFNRLRVTGASYGLHGNLLRLGAGLEAGYFGLSTLSTPLTFGSAAAVTNSNGTLSLLGPLLIDTNVTVFHISGSGNTICASNVNTIGGGGIRKVGVARLEFMGASTNLSLLQIDQGNVFVNGNWNNIPIALNGGALRGIGDGGDVTSLAGGVVAPGLSPGVMDVKSIVWNAGTTFDVELNGTSPGSGYDQLEVFSGVTLGGAGLSVSLGFMPALGDSFRIIEQNIGMVTNTFAGLPQGALLTIGNVVFTINYGNDVTLTVTGINPTGNTRVWTGAGGNGNWSNPTNWAGTIPEAPVPGDSLRFPVFESNRLTTNDFVGFVADRIIINGTNDVSRYVFHGHGLNLLGGITSVSDNDLSHEFFLRLRLLGPQTFGIGGDGGLSFLDAVDNNGFLLTTTNAGTSSITFHEQIMGSGGLTHRGSNAPALSLLGANTFTGPCTLAAGQMRAGNGFALGGASGELLIGEGTTLTFDTNFTLTKSSITLTGGNVSTFFTNTIAGEVRVFGAPIRFTRNGAARMTLTGPTVGGGQLSLFGAGTSEFLGTNTHTGGTFINDGTLLVNGETAYGNMFIGSGATLAGTGVVGSLSMSTSSQSPRLSPGASAGTLTASNVAFSGTSEFIVELNGTTPGTTHDQLAVRGTVTLANANLRLLPGFAPAFGDVFRIIDNDGADAVLGTFAGLPEGALLVTNGVSLRVSYLGGDGNDVTLTRALVGTGVTRIWDAGGANNFWSNPTNWTGDVAPVAGDAILFPSSLSPSKALTTNDLSAGTVFEQLIVRNGGGGIGTVLHGNTIGLINGVLGTNTADSFRVQLPLQLAGPQSFALSSAGYTFSAPITLNGNLTLGGGSITITGAVAGVGGIFKTNSGSFTLSANNSFDGPVQILSGVLQIAHPSALGLPGGGTFIGAGVNLLLGHTGTLAENSLSITGSVTALFTNEVRGQIELPNVGTGFNVSAARRLTLSGLMTGAGSPLFQGGGTFVLTGTNNCTGQTSIENGTLFVQGRSTAGDLNVSPSTAILGGTGVVGRLSVQNNGTLNPGSSPGVLSSSNLFAASASTLLFELNGLAAGAGYDQLDVGGTVSLGGGALQLALGFTPAVGAVFTIINNDGADAVSGTFGGLPEGATFTTNGLNFRVSYTGGTGNDVTVTRFVPATGLTRVWDGGGLNGFWSNPFNWVGDIAPVQGDTLAFPAAAARKVNTNDFASGTFFNAIQFPGNGYTLRGTPVGVISSLVGSNTTGVNFIDLDLDFGSGQTVAQHGGAGLVINGDVTVNGDLAVFGSGSVNFNGPVSGAGGVVAQGPGNVILNVANTYAGTTEVQGGTLTIGASTSLGSAATGTIVREGATLVVNAEVNVAEPLLLSGILYNSADSNEWSGPITLASPDVQIVIDDQALTVSGVISGTDGFIKRGTEILRLTAANTYSGDTILADGKLLVDGVQPSSRIRLAGGTLGGNGVVERIADSGGGTVAPGVSPGILSSSNLTLGASSIFAVELNGAIAGAGHDRLNVSGSVALGDAALDVSLGFTPAPGSSMTILENDGADAINGIFAGRPEGSLITNGAVVMQLTYAGGSGNDVVLTRLAAPTGVTRIWDGGGVGNLWTTATNWVGDVAPQPGDDIVFPAGVSKNPHFNAGTNATFNTVLFGSDYTLTVAAGHSLRLLNGLTATNTIGIVNIFAPITLANSQTWTVMNSLRTLQVRRVNLGAATLTHTGAGDLVILETISGSGGLTGHATGGLFLEGTNTFTGPISMHAGILTVLSPEAFGSTLGGTFIDATAALSLELPHAAAVNEPLTLAGRVQFYVGRTNSWNGPIVLAGAQAAFELFTLSRLEINGPVSGTGFQSLGIAATVLNGNDTFAGPVRVAQSSRVLVNSSHAAVNFVLTNSSQLGGTGVVGQISAPICIGCEVQPGPVNEPGVLRSGNLSLGLASRLRAEINGPAAGSGYDQLDVTGTIALTNASLIVTAAFNPAAGLIFTLINNDGSDAIAGTFQGLPQNALLTNNGVIFRISYTGGDGNDVTLTSTVGAPSSAIQFSGIHSNGLFTLTGAGLSNALYVLEATPHLNTPIPWQPILTNTSGTNGLYQFIDPNSTNFPIRFYRVRSP